MQTLEQSVNRLKALAGEEPISREIALRTVNVELYIGWLKREACRKKAAAIPMPGPTLGAFMDDAIEVQGKKVCRIVPAHFFVLQKIESPLLGIMSQLAEERQAALRMDNEQLWDICYLFTNDPRDVYSLVRKGGKEALREASGSIALEWAAELPELVVMAVMEQIKRHVLTKSEILNKMRGEGRITFFQEPEQTPAKKTESGGCSNITSSTENITPLKPETK